MKDKVSNKVHKKKPILRYIKCRISDYTPVKDASEALYDAMGLEDRPGQKQMLLTMAEDMDRIYLSNNQRESDKENDIETDESIAPYKLFISEAPVGTGKSYVLILLAFVSWCLFRKTTVISTQTKVLQNQLCCKDIPMFKKLMTKAVEKGLLDPIAIEAWHYSVIKGRSNYLCSHKINTCLKLTDRFGDIYLKSPAAPAGIPVSYATFSQIQNSVNNIRRDIDRAGEGMVVENDPVYSAVVASQHVCENERDYCAYYPGHCPYTISVLTNAPLLITNHAMLRGYIMMTKDTDEDGNVFNEDVNTETLPLLSANNYFFDEAHHLMGYQSGHVIVDSADTADILSYLSTPLPLAIDKQALQSVTEARDCAWKSWNSLLKDIVMYFEQGRSTDNKNKSIENINTEIVLRVKNTAIEFNQQLEAVKTISITNMWREYADIICRDIDAALAIMRKLENAADRGCLSISNINCGVSDQGVTWSSYDNRSFDEDLHQAAPSMEFTAFTSGTIMMDGDSGVFEAETGLKPNCSTLQVPSSFSHRMINMWIPKDNQIFPMFAQDRLSRNKHYQAFEKFCLTYIPPYIKQEKLGGVLVLCTSMSRIHALREKLEPAIREAHRHLFVQGDQKLPRAMLVKEFLRTPSSVLLASNSFREGFDAPGGKLTWVILDKLPFSNPSNEEYAIRMRMLKDKGLIQDERAHAIQLMLFDLVQSIGRLERTTSDWGTFTILDPRICWLIDNHGDPSKPGKWNDKDNPWRQYLKSPINDLLPYIFENKSRLIDYMPRPSKWIEIAENTQKRAEAQCSLYNFTQNNNSSM